MPGHSRCLVNTDGYMNPSPEIIKKVVFLFFYHPLAYDIRKLSKCLLPNLPNGIKKISALTPFQRWFKTLEARDTWLAQSIEHATLDLRVVSSSPALGAKLT